MPHLQSWHWTEAGRSLSKVSLAYRARTWTARPTQRMKKKGKVPKQSLILECILSTAAFMQTEIHRKPILELKVSHLKEDLMFSHRNLHIRTNLMTSASAMKM